MCRGKLLEVEPFVDYKIRRYFNMKPILFSLCRDLSKQWKRLGQ